MSESLRRKSDPPQPAPVLSHEDIAEQVAQYLARGGRVEVVPTGQGAPVLTRTQKHNAARRHQ